MYMYICIQRKFDANYYFFTDPLKALTLPLHCTVMSACCCQIKNVHGFSWAHRLGWTMDTMCDTDQISDGILIHSPVVYPKRHCCCWMCPVVHTFYSFPYLQPNQAITSSFKKEIPTTEWFFQVHAQSKKSVQEIIRNQDDIISPKLHPWTCTPVSLSLSVSMVLTWAAARQRSLLQKPTV